MGKIGFYTLGVLRAPVTAPEIAPMANFLFPMWGIAAQSSGFVALANEAANIPTDRRWGPEVVPSIVQGAEYEQRLFYTLSIWEDIESVFAFSYWGLHKDALQQRRDWFIQTPWPNYVAWWIADEYSPTWAEACERYVHLMEKGPTPTAFNFYNPFDAEGKACHLDRSLIEVKSGPSPDDV